VTQLCPLGTPGAAPLRPGCERVEERESLLTRCVRSKGAVLGTPTWPQSHCMSVALKLWSVSDRGGSGFLVVLPSHSTPSFPEEEQGRVPQRTVQIGGASVALKIPASPNWEISSGSLSVTHPSKKPRLPRVSGLPWLHCVSVSEPGHDSCPASAKHA
jgi:hypothetical protein